jgi:protein-tyrosine phosphatase
MSLTGEFGKKIKICAETLLERRLVQIIASDAHDSSERPPILSRAVKGASAIIGSEEAERMVTSIPEAVIDGKRVENFSPGLRGN